MRGLERAGVWLALLAGFVATGVSSAQQIPTGPQGESYASIAKLPNWSGLWVMPEAEFLRAIITEVDPESPRAPALAPAAKKILEAFNARRMTGRQVSSGSPARTNADECIPPGMPDVMRYPAGIEFLLTPGRVTVIIEEGPTIRHIYTDGRPHSKDADPTFAGESIGHWEGATLVVETRSISPRANLIASVRTSGAARITERMFLRDPAHLQIDTVVEDPTVLREPWKYTRVYQRFDSTYRESVCMENNREPGGGEPDLTPPP
jgi:hypothetical protein